MMNHLQCLLLLIFCPIECSFINFQSHCTFYFSFHVAHSRFLLICSSCPSHESKILLRLKRALQVLDSSLNRFFIFLRVSYHERLQWKREMLVDCYDLRLLSYLDCLRNLWSHQGWYLCYRQTKDYHQFVANNLPKIYYRIVLIQPNL